MSAGPDGGRVDVGGCTLLLGDALERLAEIPDESVHACVTSPPYFGLRSYLPDGHPDKEREVGLERTVDAYVARLVEVFREVRRVLRSDGVLFLNLGDSYAGGGGGNYGNKIAADHGQHVTNVRNRPGWLASNRVKPKDLIGVPWMVAFALRADGWWLRAENIWCLSGGTRVYARTKKGEMPMTIKDMVRLDPATVQIWNGTKWTQVLGWSQTPRPDRTYEIEFRNDQRVGCTAGHLWPTQRGNVRANELAPGDIVQRCRLPEPTSPRSPSGLPDEMAGWFAGLYIAEGSRFDGSLQIASHTKEEERFARLRALAEAYHGTAAIHKTSPNGCTVTLNGPVLNGIIDAYVSGRVASDKHLHPRCWQRSDTFLRAVLDGYLSGDGHYDAENGRWRLGFCTNDELVADLRTIGARLGISVRLRRTIHVSDGREFPGYRGELRFSRSDHHNSKDDGEVVAIRESRARKFWDIGVADEPHLFALASGILTHNSKPNPMPESVQDRTTRAHEQVFMLSKGPRYFYDADAVAEPATTVGDTRHLRLDRTAQRGTEADWKHGDDRHKTGKPQASSRNLRSVWTISSQPFSDAHFATMPPALAERCIKAGTSEKGCCPACGAPSARVVERQPMEVREGPGRAGLKSAGYGSSSRTACTGTMVQPPRARTVGWRPTCSCSGAATAVPCTVLDPFAGVATTLLVASRLQRRGIGIELDERSLRMAADRIRDDATLFAGEAA